MSLVWVSVRMVTFISIEHRANSMVCLPACLQNQQNLVDKHCIKRSSMDLSNFILKVHSVFVHQIILAKTGIFRIFGSRILVSGEVDKTLGRGLISTLILLGPCILYMGRCLFGSSQVLIHVPPCLKVMQEAGVPSASFVVTGVALSMKVIFGGSL